MAYSSGRPRPFVIYAHPLSTPTRFWDKYYKCRLKRTRQESSSEEPEAKKSRQDREGDEEDSGCLIYIVSTKLSSGHLRHLKNVAGKKGFKVVDTLRY